MNRRRYGREDEYNRENYGSYGNAGFENDYNKNRRNESYGNMNTGYNSSNEDKNWRRGYEQQGSDTWNERQGNMQNVGYGTIYHGNVERREQETNQAQGGRYMNMNRGNRSSGNYGNDYGDSYRSGNYGNDYGDNFRSGNYSSGNYGSNQGSNFGNRSNYDETRRGREDRDWWDRTKDEVKSWTGDDDAERRRDMDKRMAGQHRGKGPRGYSRSDDRIKEDVCERLSDDSYVDASDIDIRVEGSEVVLSGTVNSKEEKRRAEDIAESISGVRNVENHLKVNTRASDYGYDTSSGRYDRGDKDRMRTSGGMGDYTGTTDDASGIGRKSGTTNEIIRDMNGNKDLNT
jgi:osmotically-inducible protein OsmY